MAKNSRKTFIYKRDIRFESVFRSFRTYLGSYSHYILSWSIDLSKSRYKSGWKHDDYSGGWYQTGTYIQPPQLSEFLGKKTIT